MPTEKINGIMMHYETFGDRGPWVALSPGGRREGAGARGSPSAWRRRVTAR